MSGGSFNYACAKECPEIIESDSYKQNIYDIVDYLKCDGYNDVADDVLEILNKLKDVEIACRRLNKYIDSISDVLKAVEWYNSGDYGVETYKKVLAEYRKEKHVLSL